MDSNAKGAFERVALTWRDIEALSKTLAEKIDWSKYDAIFPILRGGVYPAVELSKRSGKPIVWELSAEVDARTLIVDDICDSGKTIAPFAARGYDTATLHFKEKSAAPTYCAQTSSAWIVYPWESTKDEETIVTRQIEYIGDTPTRPELVDAPRRVVESWSTIYRGYQASPREIIRANTRFVTSEEDRELVVLENCGFYSTCEERMLPFYGSATVVVKPAEATIDVATLERLVDCFSRRLQNQDRMCDEIADALMRELAPIAVYVEARSRNLSAVAFEEPGFMKRSKAKRGDFSKIRREYDV